MSDKDIDKNTDDNIMFNNEDLETLNANVWINKMENELLHCLTKEDAKAGFLQYGMVMSHYRDIVQAKGIIDGEKFDKEYKDEVEANSFDNLNTEQKDLKKAMLKHRLILKSVLKNRKSSANLEYKG